jgi:hypothetical protein
LHYKFLRSGFEPKDMKTLTEPTTEAVKSKKVVGISSLNDLQNLAPGEREDTIRDYKMDKLRKEHDEKVTEQVSKKWGPEVKDNVSPLIHRRSITREEFQQVLKGNFDEEKV